MSLPRIDVRQHKLNLLNILTEDISFHLLHYFLISIQGLYTIEEKLKFFGDDLISNYSKLKSFKNSYKFKKINQKIFFNFHIFTRL
jgi:hypothetical protein